MIYPKKLEKGDTIGIICPSSPISEERQTQCVKALESLGYKVKAADNLIQRKIGIQNNKPIVVGIRDINQAVRTDLNIGRIGKRAHRLAGCVY